MNETVPVQIQRLAHGRGLDLPAYQSEHAAGMDIQAAVAETLLLQPGERALIPTGFAIAIPLGYEVQIRPRSGLATKHGICVPNAPGTIDADYRGEVKVPLMNLGSEPFAVERGMRIAQMLLKRIPRTTWVEVQTLPPTERADGGFGHTG